MQENGEIWIKGELGNLTIRANSYSMSVRDGSLCKWYLGDNFKILGRGDTQQAIEALSDALHLPMERATITRIDVAAGFIMDYPAQVYFDHLGQMRQTRRLQQPSGLYYTQSTNNLVFYDKIREERTHKEAIPELYQRKNVLRYEYRVLSRLPKTLKTPEVTASMLYDRHFYNYLLNRWRDGYTAIQKINETNINFKMVNTKKDLYRWGLLAGIERIGGQKEMMRQISEAQQRGDLTNKQAHDFRAAVKKACMVDGELITESEAIKELDKRVVEAYRMYS